MGVSSSSVDSSSSGSSNHRHHQLPGRKLSGLGKVRIPPSAEAPISSLWNAEPRLILANNSDYIVSYWAIEEDKKRTPAQQERIVKSIALHLNASKIAGSNLSEDLKRLKEEEALAKATGKDEEDDSVYYLTRDHRMGRKGSTQPTHVPFPAGCRHVRLYGFYESDGEWQPYKDKVYSIALRNKNFRVNASTAGITPHAGLDQNGPARRKKKVRAAKRRGQQVTA